MRDFVVAIRFNWKSNLCSISGNTHRKKPTTTCIDRICLVLFVCSLTLTHFYAWIILWAAYCNFNLSCFSSCRFIVSNKTHSTPRWNMLEIVQLDYILKWLIKNEFNSIFISLFHMKNGVENFLLFVSILVVCVLFCSSTFAIHLLFIEFRYFVFFFFICWMKLVQLQLFLLWFFLRTILFDRNVMFFFLLSQCICILCKCFKANIVL